MSHFESPFLAVPAGDWLCSNDLAFAIFDGFPVSPGHVLVTTRRIVETWFDATDEEQSGLDLIQLSIFSALRAGAKIRILVGDYLYITSAEALRRLVGWMSLADEILANSSLEVRLAEISKLPSKPDSFHPKAWRIVDSSGGLLVVGSSNLSKAALETGVEWNLIGTTTGSEPIDLALATAFTDLWQQATPLDDALLSSYALHAKDAHRKFIPPETVDLPTVLHPPRPRRRRHRPRENLARRLRRARRRRGPPAPAPRPHHRPPRRNPDSSRSHRPNGHAVGMGGHVRAAAVFSGSGGDPRSDSLNAFVDGKLQALCVVDLFKSPKRATEDEWSHEHIELLPLNRDYDPIIVTPHEAPEMVVVGEWVFSID